MAPLSNKERQAAFRARKKMQPFADQHFGGLHVATVDQFLDALKIERDSMLAKFPDSDITELDIKETGWYEMECWSIEGKLAAEFSVNGDQEELKGIEVQVTQILHKKGYFPGLPDYEEAFDAELETKCRERVAAEAQRLLDEKLAALTDEQKIELVASDGYWGDPREAGYQHPLQSPQYPIYQLIAEYKRLVQLP